MDILEGYIALDAESQARNISAWTPVVAEVLQGICSWDDAILQEHVAIIYPLAVDLMARDMTQEIRESVRSGELQGHSHCDEFADGLYGYSVPSSRTGAQHLPGC